MSEFFVIFVLLLINAFFALSEMAIVSASKPMLRQMAKQGNRRAEVALRLAEDPGKFLSTVQVGITLVGTLAGAYGGATIAARIAPILDEIAWIHPYGNTVAAFFDSGPLAGAPGVEQAADAARSSIGAVGQIAADLRGRGLGSVADDLVATANAAFVDAAHHGVLVGAAASFLGIVVALVFLPSRPRDADREEQEAEYVAEHTGEFEMNA